MADSVMQPKIKNLPTEAHRMVQVGRTGFTADRIMLQVGSYDAENQQITLILLIK